MKKFAVAAFVVLALVGFVMADEFNANITKVDGNTVYYKKGGGKKGGGGGAEEKADVTSDVKVLKGTAEFIPDPAPPAKKAGAKKAGAAKKGAAKKGAAGGGTTQITAGDPLPGGLKNEIFMKIEPDSKGIQSKIITNDEGKIIEIRAVPPLE
jgi:hypothetical protein